MKHTFWAAALLALTSVGCGIESPETTGPIPATNTTATPPQNTQQNALPQQQITPATQQEATPAATPATTARLNPPHGQPGHRCDIEVGKPLDSKPIQTTIPSNQNQPVITTQPVPTNNTQGGVALNPAHGQPGHRCDIAVGAPLN